MAVTVAVVGAGGGYVEGGVSVEEAEGLEGEAGVGGGHDGPVFGAGDMVVSEDVPGDDIGVFDGAIALRPLGQTFAAGVLVGVLASGVELRLVVGGDPQVPGHKARPLEDGGVGVGEGQHVFAGDELKADGLPQAVGNVGVHHFPVAAFERIDDALGCLLGLQGGGDSVEAVLHGVVGTDGQRFGVDLVDGVGATIHIKVQPHTEEVLVDQPIQVGGDEGAVGEVVGGGTAEQDARELDFVLDGAVLVEVPEEAIFVVIDRGDEGEDETARSPHRHTVPPPIRVLPQNAEVFFMHTDSILGDGDIAPAVG